MSNSTSEQRVDQASRIILATQKAIYLAMTDAEAIASWRPPHGMTMQFERFDPRVGGGYRVTLLYPEDQRGQGKTRDDADVAEVRFIALDPFERLAGALKARDADKSDPFKYAYPSPNTLKASRARKVDVDETGRVRDPGFPMRTAVRRTRAKP